MISTARNKAEKYTVLIHSQFCGSFLFLGGPLQTTGVVDSVDPVNMGVEPVDLEVDPVNLVVEPVDFVVDPVNLVVDPVDFVVVEDADSDKVHLIVFTRGYV